MFRSELCGKHIIKDKFKLFNAVITPTVLYGSTAWTMNAERTKLIQTAQRRMLRWMLGGFWQGASRSDGGGADVTMTSESEDDEASVDEPPWDDEDEVADQEA